MARNGRRPHHLWRLKADLTLPVLELLPDGSYRSVLVSPKIKGPARAKRTEAARAGRDLDPDKAGTSGSLSTRSPTATGRTS